MAGIHSSASAPNIKTIRKDLYEKRRASKEIEVNGRRSASPKPKANFVAIDKSDFKVVKFMKEAIQIREMKTPSPVHKK